MKLLQFAIASIVDANTGNGLVSKTSSEQIRDYQESMRESRRIRSKSVIAVFNAIRNTLTSAVSAYRARAKERMGINQLLNLSDQSLRDIGLDRSDLAQLRAGLITLKQLDQKRIQGSQFDRGSQSITSVDKATRKLEAQNQDCYLQAGCA